MLIMGEHDIYNHRQPGAMEGRKLKKMIVHPRFDEKSFENDLALLELVTPVEYQPHILPACLPNEDDQLEGMLGWVTGWGKMRKGKFLSTKVAYTRLSSRWSTSISSTRARGAHPD